MEMLLRKALFFIFILCVASMGLFTRRLWVLNVYQDMFPPQNESLCACEKCIMENDSWLSNLMKASPEPFLSVKNNISLNAFSYWRRKHFDRRNFTVYNEIIDKVFQIFPPNVNVARPSPDLCRTCAVVGNSGNLIGSHYGRLIDFHDIVIRMNQAPTKGFEHDVGRKTTHHVMYPHSSKDLENSTHLVFFPFKTADFDWLISAFTQRNKTAEGSGSDTNTNAGSRSKAKTNARSGLKSNTKADSEIKANKNLVMILSPAFMKYVHLTWLKGQGIYPSTGFITVILSLHMCDEVNVFGFGADKHGNWNHYFERLRNKRLRTGHHPGGQEFRVIVDLHKRNKINFFRGW